ncbi:MAG TPA: shikimate dehydrogenase [Chthoniobacterales bacterium]|nr:shikimate dehydrogenase [Chthoniobacterales bacterium]
MKEIYTFADLQDWRKASGRTKPPITLGVLGNPVAHSRSPEIQNASLKEAGIAMSYARFEIRAEELKSAFELFPGLGFVGLNLTIPHKIAALGLVDEADEHARKIGAVNTVKIDGDRTHGFNTDGKGFARAIREEFSVDLRDLRILLLGAGGAGRAIAFECARENCERLVIANRDLQKGSNLVDELRPFFAGPRVLGPVSRIQAIGRDDAALRFQIANSDLVVNATPLGLSRSDSLPIGAGLLEPHLMVYDTVYSGGPTALVRSAMESGARAANGLSMLLHQAALAFEIWFDRGAPLEAMRKAVQ